MEISCGQVRPGYPSMGAWVTYGLGSLNRNLPSFVVMHETKPRGEDSIWSAGFLPKNHQPVAIDARNSKPIANLDRLRNNRSYTDKILDQMFEYLYRIDTVRGTGRLYLP